MNEQRFNFIFLKKHPKKQNTKRRVVREKMEKKNRTYQSPFDHSVRAKSKITMVIQ